MLRSITRPPLRLAAACLALCGGLAAATPAIAGDRRAIGQARGSDTEGGLDHVRGRYHRRGRHAESLPGLHRPGLRGLPDPLRQPVELRPGQLRGDAEARDVLDPLEERPGLDLPHQARREVVRRRPADRGRRRVHDPAQHRARLDRVRRQRGLCRRDQEREGDRQVHGRDDGQALHPGDEQARAADPARAHLEAHQREATRLVQEPEPGRHRSVHGLQLLVQPDHHAEGQSALLGRQARHQDARLPAVRQPDRHEARARQRHH